MAANNFDSKSLPLVTDPDAYFDEALIVGDQGTNDDALLDELLPPAEDMFEADDANEEIILPAAQEDTAEKAEKPAKKRSPKQKAEPRTTAPQPQFSSEVIPENDTFASMSHFMYETTAMIRDEDRELRQESALEKMKYEAAFKQRRIVESTLDAVVTIGKEVYGVCFDGDITVRIPFMEFFQKVPASLVDPKTPNLVRARTNFLSKAIGASIFFTLTSYGSDPENNMDFYTGSRVQAMALYRRRFFGKDATDKLTVGTDIYAQILSMNEHIAYVTCCGLDIPMQNFTITHKWVEDLNAEYTVGQKIRVRIVDIVEEAGKVPILRISGRPCELKRLARNAERLKYASTTRCVAKVTTIRYDKKNNRHIASLFLEGFNYPAFCGSLSVKDIEENAITNGSTVQVELFGITKQHYIHCAIVRVIRKK